MVGSYTPFDAADIATWLHAVQHDLFELGSELAVPGYLVLNDDNVNMLEAMVERINAKLPRLKEFILPGGTRDAALAHQARAVCRRAERNLVALSHVAAVSLPARQYLNRLSDALFVLARELNRQHGEADILWQPRRHLQAAE